MCVCVCVRERENRGGLEERRQKKLGQVRQVTTPADLGGFSAVAAFGYFRLVDEINTRRVIFSSSWLLKKSPRSTAEAVSVETREYSRAFVPEPKLFKVSLSRGN